MGEYKKHFRTDIQALRAIAVLAVVVYHLWPERLTGGFMGVDIFFVISGYLMTLTLMRDIKPVLEAKKKLKATGSYLSNFYARRIKRLLPAATVTLIATLGLIIATGNFALIQETGKQVATSALFVQNLFLANESVDYLHNPEPTAVQHFWSLSLEEQFYLVWPLLLLAIIFLTVNVTVLYRKHKIPGGIIPVSLLAVSFFIYGYLLTKSDPSMAYFFTPARVWELIIGGLIAFLPQLKHYDLKLILPWIGTVMIGYALYKWDGVGFPGWHAMVPVLGTAFILYAGTTPSESKLSFSNLLKARPIQWIGDISYSLYLWHWPLIILLPILFTFNIEGEYSLYIKMGILVLSFVLAWLSYRYVEIPAQRIQLKKRWIYILSAIVVGVVAAAGFSASNVAKNETQARLTEVRELAINIESSPCLGARSIANQAKCEQSFGFRDTRFEQVDAPDLYLQSLNTGVACNVYHPTTYGPSDPTNYCEVGDPTSLHRIAVLGDSHASHWINALDSIGRKNKINFLILSSGECSWRPIDAPMCKDRTKFIRDNNLLTNVSAVLVSVWFRYDTENHLQPTASALRNAKDLTDAPVYLIEDIPPAGYAGGPKCISKGYSCKMPIESLWPLDETRNKLVDDKLIKENNIISTREIFCDENYCYSFIGGLPVYQTYNTRADPNSIGGNSHMTATYSLTTSNLLEKRLEIQGALEPKRVQPTPISSIINEDEKNRPSNQERCTK